MIKPIYEICQACKGFGNSRMMKEKSDPVDTCLFCSGDGYALTNYFTIVDSDPRIVSLQLKDHIGGEK